MLYCYRQSTLAPDNAGQGMKANNHHNMLDTLRSDYLFAWMPANENGTSTRHGET